MRVRATKNNDSRQRLAQYFEIDLTPTVILIFFKGGIMDTLDPDDDACIVDTTYTKYITLNTYTK